MTSHIPKGTISKSSRYPSTGIKSGIKSIGLNAYAATPPANNFAGQGTRESRAAIQTATTSRFRLRAQDARLNSHLLTTQSPGPQRDGEGPSLLREI